MKTKIGPKILNCIVDRPHDDPITIHGSFGGVLEIVDSPDNNNRCTFLLTVEKGHPIKNGTILTFVTFESEFVGNATILSFASIPNYNKPRNPNKRQPSFYSEGKNYTVTMILQDGFTANAFAKGSSDLQVSFPEYQSNGFLIENTKVLQGHRRGMLIKSSGTIRNSFIQGSGIVIVPQLYWAASGFVTFMNIIGNTISDYKYESLSAIYIGGFEWTSKGRNQRNIILSNNVILDSRLPNIIMNGVEGYQMKNNSFVNAFESKVVIEPFNSCPLENKNTCIINSVASSLEIDFNGNKSDVIVRKRGRFCASKKRVKLRMH